MSSVSMMSSHRHGYTNLMKAVPKRRADFLFVILFISIIIISLLLIAIIASSIIISTQSVNISSSTLDLSPSPTKNSLPFSSSVNLPFLSVTNLQSSLPSSSQSFSFSSQSLSSSLQSLPSSSQSLPSSSRSLPSSFQSIPSSSRLLPSSLRSLPSSSQSLPSSSQFLVMMSPTPTPLLMIKVQSFDGFLYILPHTDVNITCISNILDKTAITWTFNGSSNLESNIYTVIPSDSGSILNIRNFDVDRNSGHYTCKAQLGTQTVNDTVAVVDGTIRLSTNVSNTYLSVGESIIVTCTSSIPVDNIRWIYTPSPPLLPINVQSIKEGNTKAHLVIRNFISSSNQGNYECMATRDGRTVSIPLNINEKVELSLSVSPKNTIRTIKDVQTSKNIVFTCEITCLCEDATVSWMIPPNTPDPKPRNTVSFDRQMANLTFEHLQQPYTQEFCCRATHPTSGQRDDCVTVEILPDAVISVTPEEIQVPDGSTFTFNCTSNRKATLFFWTFNFNERTLPTGVSYKNVSDTLSQLTVTGATNDVNTGLYYCHAMYAETGETTRDAGNLLIEPSEANVLFDKTSPLMYSVGDSISIECQLDCLCFGEVHWKFNNDMDNFNGLTDSRSFTLREATLSTNSATQSMAGTYTCEIIAGPFAGTKETFELVLMN